MEITKEFDGVFRFTNDTDEDFKVLWNNKEYTFPKQTTCPMLIPNETLENIQEIRKKFAYKLATREFYKSKEYTRMSKMGNGLPPTFDDKVLQPWIDVCLKPLAPSRASNIDLPKDSDKNYKGTKALTDKDNPNFLFKEESASVTPLSVRFPDSPLN